MKKTSVYIMALIIVAFGLLLMSLEARGGGSIWLALVAELGLGLVVLGLLEVAIHIPLVRSYFLDTIKEAIVNDEYLSRLGDGELWNLTSRIFEIKAKHATNKKDFLAYAKEQAFFQLDKPFRANLECEIVCTPQSPDILLITDTLSYDCYGSGKDFIPEVKWINSPEEIVDMRSLSIQLKPPGKVAWTPPIATKEDFEYVYLDASDEEVASHRMKPGQKLIASRVIVPIPVAKRKDGLRVKISAAYTIRMGQFQRWTMSQLSKGIDLKLVIPAGYTVDIESFLPRVHGEIEVLTDRARVEYHSWALPDSGIAWCFRPIVTPSVPSGVYRKI